MNTGSPNGEPPGAGQEEPAGEATVLRMLLGAQLRRLREAADITAEKAGYEIRASRSKISRMETGRVGLKLRDIEDLLTLYGVAGERERGESPCPGRAVTGTGVVGAVQRHLAGLTPAETARYIKQAAKDIWKAAR